MRTEAQELADGIFSAIDALDINNCYVVLPSIGMSDEYLLEYWGTLEYHDTLKYRFSDMYQPTAREILALIHQSHKGTLDTKMFCIIDCDSGKMVGDFSLENFSGTAAQAHYSMHPDNDSQLNVFLADEATNMVLNNWSVTLEMDRPYLTTLYGIVSTKNRVSCMFIRKIGFERLGVVPDGMTYMGETSDAVISIKTRH